MIGERPHPFGPPLGWDPTTSTLIYGEYEAVLADPRQALFSAPAPGAAHPSLAVLIAPPAIGGVTYFLHDSGLNRPGRRMMPTGRGCPSSAAYATRLTWLPNSALAAWGPCGGLAGVLGGARTRTGREDVTSHPPTEPSLAGKTSPGASDGAPGGGD
jgi:hypothetical protein